MDPVIQTSIIAAIVAVVSAALTFIVTRKDVLTKGLHALIDSLQGELDRLKNEIDELRDREGSWADILRANIQLAKTNSITADRAAEYEARSKNLEKALAQAEADADELEQAREEAFEKFNLLLAHSPIERERFETLWGLHKKERRH